MGDPALHKYDDEGNDAPSSAYERARQQWGMEPSTMPTGNEAGEQPADEGSALSARERADQRWGMQTGTTRGEASTSEDTGENRRDPVDSADLKTAEASGATPSANQAEKAEQASTDMANNDIPYRDEGKRRRFRLTKKQGIVGGIIGILVGGGIGTISIVQGPLQFIHATKIFQQIHHSRVEVFGDDRSGKFAIYMLAGRSAKGRLGALSNVIADKWEARLNERAGVRSVYSSTTQRLIGYEVIDPVKARDFLREIDNAGIPRGGNFSGVDVNRNPITARAGSVDLRNYDLNNFKLRRKVTNLATRSVGVNRLSAAYGSRILKKRAGVNFHPLRDRFRNRADNFFDRRQAEREARDNELRSGDPDSPDTPSSGRLRRIHERLQTFLRTMRGPILVAASTCAAKSFSDGIDAQNLENQQQLIRMGMSVVTTGSQVMSGQDLNIATLGHLADDFYDEETGTSWTVDPGVQYEMGKEMTGKSYVEDTKPDSDGKPEIFQIIDQIPTRAGPVDLCGLGEIVASAPGVGRVLSLVESATNGLLQTFGIPTPEELVNRMIAYFASGGVNIAAQGAERGGLWNIGSRMAVNNQFIGSGGKELTPEEEMEIETTYAAIRRTEYAQKSGYEKYLDILDSESLVGRAFQKSPKTTGQFVSNMASLPRMFGSVVSGLIGPAKVLAQEEATYDYGFPQYGFSLAEQNNPAFENPYANEDTLKASLAAASTAEQSCADNSRARGEDPYPQCEQGYSSLTELNTGDSDFSSGDGDGDNSVGSDTPSLLPAGNGQECFGMQVNDDGTLVYGESGDFTKIPDECQSQLEIFVRYRFYLSDTITSHTIACYEGQASSCQQIGVGGIDRAAVAGATPAVEARGVDTSAQTCTLGTDAGIGDTPIENIKIRLCSFGGIVVNVAIEANVYAIKTQGAAAGLAYTGAGYRSNQRQRELRIINGCPDVFTAPPSSCDTPTAIPGNSLHEWGLAVDFSCNGALIRSRSTGCFRWLADNQSLHNLINLPSEPWHWSSTGN